MQKGYEIVQVNLTPLSFTTQPFYDKEQQLFQLPLTSKICLKLPELKQKLSTIYKYVT